ncbi:hypothetical protein ACFL6C_09170 [Myxococcota bacterium]
MVGLDQRIAEMKALRRQREKQQGFGRPIISSVLGEYRFVAVRDRVLHSKNWKTFHDFLFAYMRHILGSEWGNQEIAKPLLERHPIMQCYEKVCHAQRAAGLGDGRVKETAATGAMSLYLHVAYYLYLIDHNAQLQEKLLQRLRSRDQFQGARYEIAVAALFALAGYSLAFEDESDPSTTHVEFAATHLRSGRQYSVEVKSKHRPGVVWYEGPGRREPNVGRDVRVLLNKALSKSAHHDRVIFIELNLPGDSQGSAEPSWAPQVDATLRRAEAELGDEAPPAYVFVSNDTTLHNLDGVDGNQHLMVSGFRKTDFRSGKMMTLREAVEARDRHRDMYSLGDAIQQWLYVPSTFDGEIADRVFKGTQAPMQIGNRYVVPADDGAAVEGMLIDAVMSEEERKMWGVFKLDDGTNMICALEVDQSEMEIYRRYPETYFGVLRHVGGKLQTPLEAFEFFYETYKNSTREFLLKGLKDHPDQNVIKEMPREDLAKLYCELLANRLLAQKGRELNDFPRSVERR